MSNGAKTDYSVNWEELQKSFKQTALWKNYEAKVKNGKNKDARIAWMIEALEAAINCCSSF